MARYEFLRSTLSIVLCVLCVITIASFGPAYGQTPHLESHPLVVPKSAKPISINAQEFLLRRDGNQVKVWVFFTDKQIYTQSDFDRVASHSPLTMKQITRRAKTGNDRIVFADLPVRRDHTDDITRRGGKLRRVSRWLNAASFVIPHEVLSEVAELPFVASVRPVAIHTRTLDTVETTSLLESPSVESTDDIDYGAASAQLNQIYVPSVHARGYDGAGVILAIFDSGFRKSHEAFAAHYADGRVLAEYDFIFNDENTANEPGDVVSQWNHGTNCWSIAAGLDDGRLYGPAYGASYLLAKTELIGSETIAEEDNWVAALEWAEGLGADVITSSLGYLDWYTYEDMDGATCVTTIAANTAAGLGIVLCNAIGNEGPYDGTLIAPADAHDMLAVGAVDAFGNLAGFSSRGPTYDGRIKPEVCARGVSTSLATATTDVSYSSGQGTSFATPLVGGVATLLVQARPNFPPELIRQSLMETACQAEAPDNNYGWGIIDAGAALDWSCGISADIRVAHVPFTVQFTGNSPLTVSSWSWSFGEGGTSEVQNPSHYYEEPGVYDVSLTIQTDYGEISTVKPAYILALGDTLSFQSDSAYAGQQAVISVSLVNTQPMEEIDIPFTFSGGLAVRLDSTSLGERTVYFEALTWPLYDPWSSRYVCRLTADNGLESPPLPAGSGEIMKIHFTIDPLQLGGLYTTIDTLNDTHTLTLTSPYAEYEPKSLSGTLSSRHVIRGDADSSGRVDVEDALFIVNYVLNAGPEPLTTQSADVDGDLDVDIDDIVYLVDNMFRGGPPPPSP